MVSIEKISQKFIQLDEYLGLLDEIAKVSEKAFLKEREESIVDLLLSGIMKRD